jgi:3,4-dihydroxy 2-butanone 4-phosphate synthase/GTP cyclohydrolase II
MQGSTDTFSTIAEALEDLAAGRMVVVVNDEHPASEGALVLAAEHVDADAINFMTRRAGGWICLALAPERCDELGLKLMVSDSDAPFLTPIEARHGVTTGISCADQAQTMRTAIDPAKGAADLVTPGHVRPLRARPGGVLERAQHTEASVDLARLAGCRSPAAVICEIQNEDGTMARPPELRAYAERHGLKLVTIAQVIAHRSRERLVEREGTSITATGRGPLTAVRGRGPLTAVRYASPEDGRHHLALVGGEVASRDEVVVGVELECTAGELLASAGCGCRARREEILAAIERAGGGILLHLARSRQGMLSCDAPADGGLAHGAVAAHVLRDLGVGSARLVGGGPVPASALRRHGVAVLDEGASAAAGAKPRDGQSAERAATNHFRLNDRGSRLGEAQPAQRSTGFPPDARARRLRA